MKVNEYEVLLKKTREISQLGRKIISSDNLDDAFEVVYKHLNSIVSFESFSVAKYHSENQIIKFDWIYENDQRQESYETNINEKNRFSSWS